MELLDISALADRASLPLSLVRYFRDRFILYLPCVRIGRDMRFPLEAIDVLRTIDRHVRNGLAADAIEHELQNQFPVTVINALPAPHGLDSLAPATAGLQILAGALAGDLAERHDRIETALHQRHSDVVRELETRDAQLHETLASRTADIVNELESMRATLSSLAPAQQVNALWGEMTALAALLAGDADERAAMSAELAAIQHRMGQMPSTEDIRSMTSSLTALAAKAEAMQPIDRIVAEISAARAELARLGNPPAAVDPAPLFAAIAARIDQRDLEISQAISTFFASIREQFTELHAAFTDMRTDIAQFAAAHPAEIAFLELPRGAAGGSNGHGTGPLNGSRPPRRMGQPIRPSERWNPEVGNASGGA